MNPNIILATSLAAVAALLAAGIWWFQRAVGRASAFIDQIRADFGSDEEEA